MEKGTEDTSKLVQIEEVKCAIEKLPFVTVLSPVRAVKGKGRGYGVTLRCPSCEEYGSCGKKQEPPVHVSSVHPTEEACLQELLKRLQDRHVDCAEAVAKKAAADAVSAATVNPDAPNVLQAMMKLEQANARAKTANKVALEAEKEKDAAEQAVAELKRQLQPKRARSDDHAGDAHSTRRGLRRLSSLPCMMMLRQRARKPQSWHKTRSQQQLLRAVLLTEHPFRGKLPQPFLRPSVRPGLLLRIRNAAGVVRFQRRSLREGRRW